MKKPIKALKTNLVNCVGVPAEIEETMRYLPGSVLFRVRLLETGVHTWHIGNFAEQRVFRADVPDYGKDRNAGVAEYSEGCLLLRNGWEWARITPSDSVPSDSVPSDSVPFDSVRMEALSGADEVSPCRGGFIRFRKGKYYGFVSRDGKVLINPDNPDGETRYEDARDFCGGFAYVQVAGKEKEKRRLIDTHGQTALSTDAEYISDVYDGKCLIARNEREWKVIKVISDVGGENKERFLCTAGDYYNVSRWNGDCLISYATGTVHGVKNVNNDSPCAYLFDSVQQPTQGVCVVELADTRQQDRYMLINNQYKQVGGLYEKLKPVSCSLALAKRDGKYGYIDAQGQERIPFQYDDAHSFAFGTALVKENSEGGGKWKVIDTQGEMLTADGEDLLPDGVTDVIDGPVFAVLVTKECSYIFDHRYYENGVPVEEAETV